MSLITGVVTADNIQRICKICLEEKSKILNLSSIIEFSECDIESISIVNILTKVTSRGEYEIELDPTNICENCLNDLKNAYLLILKFEEADQLLQSFLETYIKEREPDPPTPRIQTRSKKTRRRARPAPPSPPSSRALHPCPICTQEFSALELRDHAHTHKTLKKYLSIPDQHKVPPTARFSTVRHLDSPRTSFFQQPHKLYKCPYCNRDFPADEFRLHIDTHRKECEFKCDQCERVFKRVNHLNTHRVKHMKEFPFKCEQCGKGFVIQRNFDCHMLTHANAELPHECSFCLRRFSNPEHLNRHQIIHTENVSYSVKYRVCRCHHCLKTFKDRDQMKTHVCMPVEQVSGLRFPCKTCNKVFKHASGLYNHNRNIHKLKGAKTLCSVCGHHVSNIYNHMMRHTGEKPFQCNQCEKKFLAKPQLKQHLLVHSGLKPFVCSVCAKAFNNLYNLQVHERIHKGNRCHICSICNKGFLEKSYLKKHMNVHNKVH